MSVSWWGQGEQTGGMGQEKIVENNIKKIMLNITISSIQMQNNIDLNMVLSKIYYQKNDSVSKFLFFLASFQSKKYFRFSVSCSELFELRCYSKSAFKLALFAHMIAKWNIIVKIDTIRIWIVKPPLMKWTIVYYYNHNIGVEAAHSSSGSLVIINVACVETLWRLLIQFSNKNNPVNFASKKPRLECPHRDKCI